MNIAYWEDVWHLVQNGELMRLHYDNEVYSLGRTATLSAFGAAAFDIADNLAGVRNVDARWTGRDLPSPEALLVTDTKFSELNDKGRLPLREAMIEVLDEFENGHRLIETLPLERRLAKFQTFRKNGGLGYRKDCVETVLEYPLKDKDGAIMNVVRYHPERNVVAYRVVQDLNSKWREHVDNDFYIDEDKSKWRMVPARLALHGQRNHHADVNWLRSSAARSGVHTTNTFFPRSRAKLSGKQRPKPNSVDDSDVHKMVAVFGPQDENGLQPAKRTDNRSLRQVLSFSLGRMAESNTRMASPARGILEGLRLPDGALFNDARTHRLPVYDALLDGSAYALDRRIAPRIVQELERQADEKYLRRFLSIRDPKKPPIFALVSDTYPLTEPFGAPYVFIGFDDQLGKSRSAFMVRVDKPLGDMRYNGKKMVEMSASDIADWIRDERRKPGSVLRSVPLAKWPGALRLEDATNGLSPDAIENADDGLVFLIQNPSLLESIRSGFEIYNHDNKERPEPANSDFIEQSTHHGFGTLDFLEREAAREQWDRKGTNYRPERGAVSGLFTLLYDRATKIYTHANGLDAALTSLALHPHPVETSDDPADLENFRELLQNVRAYFKKKGSPYRDIFGSTNLKEISLEQARNFRWRLMKKTLEDFLDECRDPRSRFKDGLYDRSYLEHGRLLYADPSREYRLTDDHDRELTVDFLLRQYAENPREVRERFDDGRWRIQFYRQSSNPSVAKTLFQFEHTGRLDQLSPAWQAQSAAERAIAIHGPINEDPGQMRRPGLESVKRKITAIEINAREGNTEGLARIFDAYRKGDAEIFGTGERAHEILSSYNADLKKLERQFRLTPEFKRAANFDPDTNTPFDWIPRTVASTNVVYIDIPSAHVSAPYDRDISLSPCAFVVPKIDAETKQKIRQGMQPILRDETGKLYHPGPVEIRKAKRVGDGYQGLIEEARRAYTDSGIPLPGPSGRDILVTELPKPVAWTRPDFNEGLKTVKLPSAFFDGLVNPKLAFREEPLTGLLMTKDLSAQDYYRNQKLRFREMIAPPNAKLMGLNGPDTGHTYETSKVTRVRTIKVGQLMQNVDDATARRCGYAGIYDLWEKTHAAMKAQQRPDPDDVVMQLIEWEPVKPDSWMYFNPSEVPQAAFTYGGKRAVPPSAYRDSAQP